MSGIRGRNTNPERCVRRELHARGFRFALHPTQLPGRPDIALTRWRVAVFVNGCFWHLHGCGLSKVPSSNRAFWLRKLRANRDRDEVAVLSLISMGWRVAIVWECGLRGARAQQQLGDAMDRLAAWIRGRNKEPLAIELPDPPSC